jgi:4-amino-4-deoxy-L-arabinose transferase-like glycosyltransferase
MRIPSYTLNRFGLVALIVLLAMPLFVRLDMLPIISWDEGLFALRASHMAETGEYLEHFGQFDDMPDHRNTKPPLITWLQVLGLKTLGYNVLALRLPVALLTFAFTVWFIFFFRKRNLPEIGIFGAFVLITSAGFVTIHVARTGDHDAPLAIFMFLGLMAFHDYVHHLGERTRLKHLAFLTLALIAAVLTKHVMGLLFGPGFILYLLAERKLLPVLRDKYLYVAIGAFFFVLLVVFGSLELNHPGFLQRMWDYELFGRYTETIDEHQHGFWYFMQIWFAGDFLPWVYLLPLGILLLGSKSHHAVHSYIKLGLLAGIPYLLIISASQTKTFWYQAPLFPILAMLAGVGLDAIYRLVLQHWPKTGFPTSVLWAYIGILFIFPYLGIIEHISHPGEVSKFDRYAYSMKILEKDHPELREYSILTKRWYIMHAKFYQLAFQKKGFDIDIRRDYSYQPNDVVLVCYNDPKAEMRERYELEILLDHRGCQTLRVIGDR